MEYNLSVKFVKITFSTCSVFATVTLHPFQLLLFHDYFHDLQFSILITNFIYTFPRIFMIKIKINCEKIELKWNRKANKVIGCLQVETYILFQKLNSFEYRVFCPTNELLHYIFHGYFINKFT